MNLEEMKEHIGVDSLAYLSMDGLYRAVDGEDRDNSSPQHCDACFSGEYPTHLTDQDDQDYHDQLSLVSLHGS